MVSPSVDGLAGRLDAPMVAMSAVSKGVAMDYAGGEVWGKAKAVQ